MTFLALKNLTVPQVPQETGPRGAGQDILQFLTGCSNSDGDHRCLAMLMVLTTVSQYYIYSFLPAEGGSIPLVLFEVSARGNLFGEDRPGRGRPLSPIPTLPSALIRGSVWSTLVQHLLYFRGPS